MARLSEREVQDHSSQYYEQRYTGYGLKYHQQIIKWLLTDWLGELPEGKILDAGCGTGIVSRLYPDLRITGCDLSPEMLKRHPGTNVLADVCAMPFEKGEFDFVLCRSLLHHLPAPQKAVAEFARVLKPQGQLVCWETNQSWLAQAIRKRTQHGDRFSEQHHAFQRGEIQQLLQRSGFEVEQTAYQGFVAYPLWGFRDIIDFQKWTPFKSISFPITLGIDAIASRTPWIRYCSFALAIKASKKV